MSIFKLMVGYCDYYHPMGNSKLEDDYSHGTLYY